MSNNTFFRMKRSVKIGTFTFVMGVIVLAALLVANLLVGALPAKLTRFSMEDQSITDISGETEKFIANMSEDVTIYWLCEDEVVDEEIALFLTRYEEAGKHVKVEIVDPVANPNFTKKYSDSTISEYSFIIESARRYTVVDFMDMYYFSNSFLASELGLTEAMSQAMLNSYVEQYASIVQMYYQINLSDYTYVHSFCGEARLTSALDFVTREYIPHAYVLTGHGNAAFSEALDSLLVSMGVEAEKCDLSKLSAIPVDAGCLILFAPETDLTEHETTLIQGYLQAGGSLIINTDPEKVTGLTNLQRVTALFGLSAAEGIVEEGQEASSTTAGCVQGKPQTLVPSVNTSYAPMYYVYNSFEAGKNVPQMADCHAITKADTLPAGVTVTSLLTTSSTANRVAPDGSGTELGTDGKLDIAVAATKSVTTANGTATQAMLTWFGSTESIAAGTSLTINDYYYASALAVMGDSFYSSYENLASVVFETGVLENLTVNSVLIVGTVTVIVLPVALLVTGIVIWSRRKRR